MVPLGRDQLPIATNPWTCPTCLGKWNQTDQRGSQWMEDKVTIMNATDQTLKNSCQNCDGDRWEVEGVAGMYHTFTGIYYGEDCPWIYQGEEGTWTSGVPIARPGANRNRDRDDQDSQSGGDTEPVTDTENEQDLPSGEPASKSDQGAAQSTDQLGRTAQNTRENIPTSCEHCGGRWYPTSTMGARWLRKKNQDLERDECWEYHECDQCRGGIWEGIRNDRHVVTSLGIK